MKYFIQFTEKRKKNHPFRIICQMRKRKTNWKFGVVAECSKKKKKKKIAMKFKEFINFLLNFHTVEINQRPKGKIA